ncbi:MAG: N-acetylmuramoyl-L-alanine amidase [Clostridiales bacterium]|nr:N-acetylmuramoyl-L-alanine amidase [Clostridiales bacterium]
MVRIGIDPGHGGADTGACGMGYQEKDIALDVALRLRKQLQACGVDVIMSRDGDWKYFIDQGADLTRRAQVFNDANCDAVISLHLNSAMQPAWGVETYTWDGNDIANSFGDSVHNAVSHLNPVNRGRKFANFAIVRETDAVACLVEMSFINSDDVRNVVGHEDEWAKCLCKGICDYFGIAKQADVKNQNQPVQANLNNIISAPTATVEQGKAWARDKGAADWFIDTADIFWSVGTQYGVNPAGVYAQSALETGFGKFGGVIDETYFNPCGLKRPEGGGNYDPNAHMRFVSWKEGIIAQVHHLLLYAGKPQNPTPDPRHFSWLSGKARTWVDLGGNWAPSKDYGRKILDMIVEMKNTNVSEPEKKVPEHAYVIPEWAADAFKRSKEHGFTDGTRLNEPPTRLEMAVGYERVYEKVMEKVTELLSK